MKFCQKTTTEQIANLLDHAHRIAIFAHTRPDGDTIGASLALCLSMKKLGKTAEVFCDTPLNGTFLKFEDCDNVHNSIEDTFDLYVAVDCADLSRLGKFAGLFASFRNTVTIDHHCGEYYSKYNCVLPMASTCQIIDSILKILKVDYTENISTFLYMGLCTDTGNFSNSSLDKSCFLLAAELIDCGADVLKISRVFFQELSLGKTRLIGRCINRIRTYMEGKVAIVYALKSDFEELELDPFGSTEGLVQYAFNIDSVKVGIAISQHSEHSYKVSMRGKNVDVRKICQEFGGGGHMYASGCMVSGFFEDAVDKIVRAVGYYL